MKAHVGDRQMGQLFNIPGYNLVYVDKNQDMTWHILNYTRF
jgi:hypothetical protein